jgi:hypothetical protein
VSSGGPSLAGLTAGASGQPAHTDPAGDLTELRRQQRRCSWDVATPLVRDAGTAYREVVGPPEQRNDKRAAGRGSTFL